MKEKIHLLQNFKGVHERREEFLTVVCVEFSHCYILVSVMTLPVLTSCLQSVYCGLSWSDCVIISTSAGHSH